MSWSKVRWQEKLCGILALACLVGTVAAALQLQQGSVADRVWVAVCLVLTAALGGLLLKKENVPINQILVLLLPLAAAMLVRCLLLDHESDDYLTFLSQWYDVIREGGGFGAISQPVGNYNVPYLYFIALISCLDIPDLYLYKLFSIFLDVILAWGGLRLVRVLTKEKENTILPQIAFGVLLFVPTVVLNGQAPDGVYHASVGCAVAGGPGEVPGAVCVPRGVCPHGNSSPAAGQALEGHFVRLLGADGGV